MKPQTGVLAFALIVAAGSAGTLAAQSDNRFQNDIERAGFLEALREKDAQYDAREQMLRRPFSSPGYHTTLKGGVVHPTRESLAYAVACLDSGDAEHLARAEAILRRVIALQDQNPASRTYGIWSWFLEEPLAKMSPPDWNWADFCGTQLLQVALDHAGRLPNDLREKIRDSILHAAAAIQKRDVGPGYTNIALMGTYVTLVAGEHFNVAELRDYGKARLKRFAAFTAEQGSFSEYNSPTYTIVAITEITRMMQHVRDAESQRLLADLNRFAWQHVARRFHPPTRQWAGPHSRCYDTMLSSRTLAFIHRATEGRARLMNDAEAAISLDACRVRARCPEDRIAHFVALEKPREERETFIQGGTGRPNIIGTTWLRPEFALGSVNVGDLWNQRRPLIAYCKTAGGAAALRLRCLHDGYDYASAAYFSVQHQGDLLGAVVFATDGGDTHPSLDRIKNAAIRAKELCVRFQIEGDIGGIEWPKSAVFNQPVQLKIGEAVSNLTIARATFGNFAPTLEAGSDGRSAWLDVVLYRGEPRSLSFVELQQAVVGFALSMRSASDGPEKTDSSDRSDPTDRSDGYVTGLSVSSQHTIGDSLVLTWKRTGRPHLQLSVPTKPAPLGALRSTAAARLNGHDAWK